MTIGGFVTFYLFLIVVLSLSIALYINYVQPKPYMDEVFHVPQAQQYCNGNFSSVRYLVEACILRIAQLAQDVWMRRPAKSNKSANARVNDPCHHFESKIILFSN